MSYSGELGMSFRGQLISVRKMAHLLSEERRIDIAKALGNEGLDPSGRKLLESHTRKKRQVEGGQVWYLKNGRRYFISDEGGQRRMTLVETVRRESIVRFWRD